MIEIVEGEWFRLPHLGTDNFKTLMSLGLKYDKAKGMLIDSETNKNLLITFLTQVLKDDVQIYKKCAICEARIDCRTCEYSSDCDFLKASENCLCSKCLEREESYAYYIMNSETF